MLLEVSLTPALYPYRTLTSHHATVAIDVLRATTAVCAAFQAGCREVVREGRNGLRVPPRDPRALATALEYFLRRPEEIAVMGAASRRLAESDFDAETVAARILTAMKVETLP